MRSPKSNLCFPESPYLCSHYLTWHNSRLLGEIKRVIWNSSIWCKEFLGLGLQLAAFFSIPIFDKMQKLGLGWFVLRLLLSQNNVFMWKM